MSNKNRSYRSHDNDNDSDHVISNEETITNEIADPVAASDHVSSSNVSSADPTTVSNNTDVASSNSTDVASSNNTNIASSNNTDVAISNNADVASSNNSDGISSNNTDVAISNSTGVASGNYTGSPGNVLSSSGNGAISNGNLTADNTWNIREQEYCTTISNMKRTMEALSIKEKKLVDDLTELHDKYKSLEESTSQKIATISSEKEQYETQAKELQRKVDNITSTITVSDRQGADVSLPLTPCGDTWKPVNLSDIKVTYNSVYQINAVKLLSYCIWCNSFGYFTVIVPTLCQFSIISFCVSTIVELNKK